MFDFSINAAVQCYLPRPLRGTRYSLGNRSVFLPDDRVTVTCGKRYWIFNRQHTSTETTCSDEGQWTVEPTCQGIKQHGL